MCYCVVSLTQLKRSGAEAAAPLRLPRSELTGFSLYSSGRGARGFPASRRPAGTQTRHTPCSTQDSYRLRVNIQKPRVLLARSPAAAAPREQGGQHPGRAQVGETPSETPQLPRPVPSSRRLHGLGCCPDGSRRVCLPGQHQGSWAPLR